MKISISLLFQRDLKKINLKNLPCNKNHSPIKKRIRKKQQILINRKLLSRKLEKLKNFERLDNRNKRIPR